MLYRLMHCKCGTFYFVYIRDWFTNLDYPERHEELVLYKRYTPEEYPKYDNYDAINIDKTTDIPYDYDGIMGVPITFIDKYNPEHVAIEELFFNTILAKV